MEDLRGISSIRPYAILVDLRPKISRKSIGESMSAKLSDRFEFERVLWAQGLTRVAGVDEAGRGPLAGPVIAAAAILPAKGGRVPRPVEVAQ